VVDDMPDSPSDAYPQKRTNKTDNTIWHREAHQRNAIARGFGKSKDDILILSDIDEIPEPKIIAEFDSDGIWSLEQELYFFFLNCRQFRGGKAANWVGPLIGKAKYFVDLEQQRRIKDTYPLIQNGGWHFTFLGGFDKIQEKLKSFAHTELNNEIIFDSVKQILKQQRFVDPFASVMPYRKNLYYEVVRLPATHPQYILDNLDKYKQYVQKLILF
jgi:beta-1,4-mannosyl-glycoprotein beta-1,4-N-acetylglucosaminyltransferase